MMEDLSTVTQTALARRSPDCETPPPLGDRRVVVAICGLLCLAVILVFCQTGRYDFVNFDDDRYVYDNDHIKHGLTLEGLEFYLCHWHSYTYHPLTTYSHMLDCQLFGLKAGGHHAVNIFLHAITATLLFLLIRQMTGRVWASALVASLFAVHPLRAESVAWISERKDVLSGLFFILTLGAYVRYARARKTSGRYATVCLLYVLGLLAKPMLVTLPMVLLLLDYWPLRRWHASDEYGHELEPMLLCNQEADSPQCLEPVMPDAGTIPMRSKAGRIPWHLIIEKIPLLLVSLAASALTIHTQADAIQPLEAIPLPTRCANTLVAYASYLGCFFWPEGLAILYPRASDGHSAGTVVAATAILAVVSAATFVWRRQAPYLLVGWLWYLGMLVPVIGLVQVGGQSMADRYTYLPQIGLALGLVWAASDFIDFLGARAGATIQRSSRFFSAIATAGIVAALAVGTWRQTGYWRDSEALWVRDSMYPNSVGQYNFGLALAGANRHEEAVKQFEGAYTLSPTDEDTLYAYAQSLEALGRVADAKVKYREALAVNKKLVNANDRLASILLGQGKDREALACWRQALADDPNNVAIGHRVADLLATSPDASVRNGKEAVFVAQRIVELTAGKDPAALDTLAAAQAESGNFVAAVQTAQTALELASAASGVDESAGEIQTHLACYRARKPHRRSATPATSSAGVIHPTPTSEPK